MKRSEMIKKLETLLYNTENIEIPSNIYINANSLAEEILNMLENEGMSLIGEFEPGCGRCAERWKSEDE